MPRANKPRAATPDKTDEILDRLDKVLRILALQVAADKNATDAAWALRLAGLDYQTIAEILGTKASTVRALVSKVRSGSSYTTR